ncbi:PadR family transcriptional regulator [Conexibacter sp. CPCC 206217]|uniref:PadR family transcriptional regulator n=1 Tax=Conexibacter sp. CPCC 206217 TaxID=3064574 RepID=UPI0027191845|nr:PadR family transcriptional regulator [Conexibacter sp. CPCC 206217]MDO8209471.1 PadR family transcriptional regulator [Conexibacter sp. CPCC 206217]
MLGLLIEQPSYGYELSKRFEARFGERLHVSRSHIYAALNSLLGDGLIEPLPSDSSSRQPKIHYRVTSAGAQAFRSCIAEQLLDGVQRAQLLGQLAAIGVRERAEVLELVDGHEHALQAALGELAASQRSRER